ncbi:DUF4386 domain-containing protein [Candidatus Kaiserbacteria bacterium CG10_big_fil_rev_8_21_14_0_10_45_20]|uniref:DUF4386 domain-containing protein n=1 Tax=Candidatus Kaiserbacteria bacterium CG10_big_fil_rev_8_21_14_0_10_45_20 TaxID=1974607 RepID=A0A2H0UFL4_9BACT|nr:MAG: DUF4386 domain-containing protein [Candidatus Kaiserbacteria bacterium CG10_big_fil_rev_8_21_14_0_10_45_20]
MNTKELFLTVGISYLIIFVTAIFANFFALEVLINNPLGAINENGLLIRVGAMAFLIAALLDIVIAWGLYELYKEHILSRLSTYLRLTHAVLMGGAVFALLLVFNFDTSADILNQVDIFNYIWLTGLFFFGFHLILLTRIIKLPRFISIFLLLAGVMYIVDTSAHFLLSNYTAYADVFLMLVAIPSIFGEMALGLWFLVKGLKRN